MKGPVCKDDIRSGRLCMICAAKLKAKQINELDFETMKAVEKLENKKFLISTEIVRVFELNGVALIFAKGNVGALIGKEGKNVKALEKALGKRVRIIELSKKPREVTQQVIGRARITAVNKLFKPGSEELRIMIDPRDKRMLEKEIKRMQEILGKALKIQIELKFAQ
ncbi:MAG: KH domain-containing protein [archaeon]|nr:KH domain-containing protein [archaeon]